jgi:hypothetical protein
MEGAQRQGDLIGSLEDLRRSQRLAAHKARDEASVESGCDLWCKTESCSCFVGDPLGRAADAEQIGVLPVHSHDILPVTQRDTEVAVGDASLQRDRLPAEKTQGGFQGLQDVAQLTHRSPTTFAR